MSKEKEDVEEVDKTKQQFGISESEMKSKLQQVVETWDSTSGASFAAPPPFGTSMLSSPAEQGNNWLLLNSTAVDIRWYIRLPFWEF